MVHLAILWPYARFGDWSPAFSWFGVLLVIVTRMDVLMCFQADVLLEIMRVHVSGQVKVSRSSLGRGWFHMLVRSQVSTALEDFVTLWSIRGCALGPLEASALDGKTSSPYGKER